MSFREEDDIEIVGGGGELPPIDDHSDGDDGPDGSCWGECGRDAPEGKRLCDVCAEGSCATCAGFGTTSGMEVLGGHVCHVQRTCTECRGEEREIR